MRIPSRTICRRRDHGVTCLIHRQLILLVLSQIVSVDVSGTSVRWSYGVFSDPDKPDR